MERASFPAMAISPSEVMNHLYFSNHSWFLFIFDFTLEVFFLVFDWVRINFSAFAAFASNVFAFLKCKEALASGDLEGIILKEIPSIEVLNSDLKSL